MVTADPVLERVPLTQDELNPDLVAICACESSGSKVGTPRQFLPDGSVVRGHINPMDVGMCQINEYYHLKEAQRLGIDIYTSEGNIEYANLLYEEEGSVPWNSSRNCWA